METGTPACRFDAQTMIFFFLLSCSLSHYQPLSILPLLLFFFFLPPLHSLRLSLIHIFLGGAIFLLQGSSPSLLILAGFIHSDAFYLPLNSFMSTCHRRSHCCLPPLSSLSPLVMSSSVALPFHLSPSLPGLLFIFSCCPSFPPLPYNLWL